MFKAILFDLDGTLLPMDNNQFIAEYLKILGAYMQKYLEPVKFIEHLNLSTTAMLSNKEDDKTNEEVFVENFFQHPAFEEEKILPVFEKFYETEFPKLKRYTRYSDLIPKILAEVNKKGFSLVVATNPVFPEIAIKQRLEWAGLVDLPFELITTYENMHFCKPSLQYYLEISDMLKIEPEKCLMVGNDAGEDMAAKAAGMSTFLVEDCIIMPENILWEPDYRGSLEQFYSFIIKLPDREEG